jgi:hypothetical protein
MSARNGVPVADQFHTKKNLLQDVPFALLSLLAKKKGRGRQEGGMLIIARWLAVKERAL